MHADWLSSLFGDSLWTQSPFRWTRIHSVAFWYSLFFTVFLITILRVFWLLEPTKTLRNTKSRTVRAALYHIYGNRESINWINLIIQYSIHDSSIWPLPSGMYFKYYTTQVALSRIQSGREPRKRLSNGQDFGKIRLCRERVLTGRKKFDLKIFNLLCVSCI